MDFVGTAFENKPSELGTVDAVEAGDYLWCTLTVGQVEVIRFPLPLGTLQSEVELHMANVINQTGLITGAAAVTIVEV